jgi:hypothetical protein
MNLHTLLLLAEFCLSRASIHSVIRVNTLIELLHHNVLAHSKGGLVEIDASSGEL